MSVTFKDNDDLCSKYTMIESGHHGSSYVCALSNDYPCVPKSGSVQGNLSLSEKKL